MSVVVKTVIGQEYRPEYEVFVIVKPVLYTCPLRRSVCGNMKLRAASAP